jgi:ribonuclease HI
VVYKALIRSVLLYGSVATNYAAKSNKAKLDTLQAKALRIVCGAMSSTPIHLLLAYCDELPLQEYRTFENIKKTICTSINKQNPARETRKNCFKPNHNCDQCKGFFSGKNIDILPFPAYTKYPMWCSEPNIDLDLTKSVSKKDGNDLARVISLNHMEKYSNSTPIFTDGSKDDDSTGAGVYAPTLSVERSYGLPNHFSVYASELYAIFCALRLAFSRKIDSLTIYTDSLSACHSIRSGKSKNNSLLNLVYDLLYLLTKREADINIVWIPSHVGIKGNEKVDKLAKEALDLEEIKYTPEKWTIIKEAHNFVWEKWQKEWFDDDRGRRFKDEIKDVHKGYFKIHKNRRKDKTLARIRMGHVLLNDRLCIFKKHPDDLCSQCKVPENIEHYVWQCAQYVEAQTELIQKVRSMGITPSLNNILFLEKCSDPLYEYILATGRKL